MINNTSKTEKLVKNLLAYWKKVHWQEAHRETEPHHKDARLIETHISWLILVGNHAYKLKKPVNLGFVDFSTLEKRKFYCEEEIRLNKRTAPEIYLQVIPISGSEKAPRPEDPAEPFEYLVKMRRFEDNCLLLDKLSLSLLNTTMVANLAKNISSFHKQIAGSSKKPPDYGSPQQVIMPVYENIKQLRQVIGKQASGSALDPLQFWSEERYSELTPWFRKRRKEGHVRECHGDLHLGNIFYQNGNCVLFDGIEFDPNLRWIDTANDIAFTIMDLESHNRPDFSHQLLNEYLELTGDYDALKLLPFYLVYRALVRAKVSALRSRQPHADRKASLDECNHYISIAENYTKPLFPSLTIMCGLSGTGKTTVAKKLVADTGAIQLRSDVERKRIFNMEPDENSQNRGIDIYTESINTKTFARLNELARKTIEAGYPVIVDATFIKSTLRQEFATLAEEYRIPFAIVHTTSTSLEAERRLQTRTGDASEAGFMQYQQQKQIFEEFSDEESRKVFTIRTDHKESGELIKQVSDWIQKQRRQKRMVHP